MKFPAVFREKLQLGEIELPDEVCFEYDPILAYRCIKRSISDDSPVTREDFRSNAELGRTNFKNKIEHPERLPEYYGVSFYREKQQLELRMSLPRKNRKVVSGHICQEGGPVLCSTQSTHVCWWLYENAGTGDFKIED